MIARRLKRYAALTMPQMAHELRQAFADEAKKPTVFFLGAKFEFKKHYDQVVVKGLRYHTEPLAFRFDMDEDQQTAVMRYKKYEYPSNEDAGELVRAFRLLREIKYQKQPLRTHLDLKEQLTHAVFSRVGREEDVKTAVMVILDLPGLHQCHDRG